MQPPESRPERYDVLRASRKVAENSRDNKQGGGEKKVFTSNGFKHLQKYAQLVMLIKAELSKDYALYRLPY